MNLYELLKEKMEREQVIKEINSRYSSELERAKNSLEETKTIMKNSLLFDLDVINIIASLLSSKEHLMYIPVVIKATWETNGIPVEIHGNYVRGKYHSHYYVFVDKASIINSLTNKKAISNYAKSRIFNNQLNDYATSQFYDDGFLRVEMKEEVNNSGKKGYNIITEDFKKIGNGTCLSFASIDENSYGIYFDVNDNRGYASFEDDNNFYNYVNEFIKYLFELQIQNNGKHLTREEMKKAMYDFLGKELQKAMNDFLELKKDKPKQKIKEKES